MIEAPNEQLPDLANSVIALQDLQELCNDLADTGAAPSPELETRLTTLLDHVDELIVSALETGTNAPLERALEALIQSDKEDAYLFLEAAIEAFATEVRTAEGNLQQMLLLPLLVSSETCNSPLSGDQCRQLAQLLYQAQGFEMAKKIRVGRRLKTPDEVYEWGYAQVYQQTKGDVLTLGHLATQNFRQPSSLDWEPELRFLPVFVTKEPSSELVVAENSAIRFPAAALEALAVPFGSPLVHGALHTVYAAREEGMQAYVDLVAELSIKRQLQVVAVVPASMVVTYHAVVPDEEGADICQVRVALIDTAGHVLAGHIIETNDWMTVNDVNQTLECICLLGGLRTIRQAPTIIGMSDSSHSAPLFCNGLDWFQLDTERLRLKQATFW